MLQWYYFALMSSILLGMFTILEKFSLKQEHATAFASAFSFIAAIISLPLLLLSQSFSFSPLQLALVFANGVLIALTYLLAARVYKHGSVSVASAAFSSLPSLFVVLLALPLLGETLTLTQYVSIAVITVVIYSLLFDRRRAKAFDSSKYTTMIIVRSFLVAAQAILTKYILLMGVDVYAFFVLSEMFVAFDFAVFISLKYGGMKEIASTVRRYTIPIALMAVLTLGYGLTYYISLMGTDVSLVTPVRNTLYVVMTVIAGGLLFKEDDMVRKLALGLILLLFTYLLIIGTV
jgi:drug/metabolite transporter (DMT)-like permease